MGYLYLSMDVCFSIVKGKLYLFTNLWKYIK